MHYKPRSKRDNGLITVTIIAIVSLIIAGTILVTTLNKNTEASTEYVEVIKQDVMEQEGIDEEDIYIKLYKRDFNDYAYKLVIPKGTYIVTVKDHEIKYEFQHE